MSKLANRPSRQPGFSSPGLTPRDASKEAGPSPQSATADRPRIVSPGCTRSSSSSTRGRKPHEYRPEFASPGRTRENRRLGRRNAVRPIGHLTNKKRIKRNGPAPVTGTGRPAAGIAFRSNALQKASITLASADFHPFHSSSVGGTGAEMSLVRPATPRWLTRQRFFPSL
jgi:hypothetical protein